MPDQESKAHLRRCTGKLVRALPSDERKIFDECIAVHVRSLESFCRARQVLAYRALGDEVCLDPLLKECVDAGKMVFLPIVTPGGSLVFRRWTVAGPLRRSSFGVEEPVGGACPTELPSIILVPGRAFDRCGYRLGRGHGCYDRSIDVLRRLGPTVGVGYNCQVVERVPRVPHDRPVDVVVTERGVLFAPRG